MKYWIEMAFVIILTGIVCYQGWLIKDLRTQNITQESSIHKLMDQQKETMDVDKQQTEAILIITEKIKGR